jgi:hypothetical protein
MMFAGYYSTATSLLTLEGSNFAVNGNAVIPGTYASLYGRNGLITGTLADGSMLNAPFKINGNANILMIPEPASAFMLVMGAVFIVTKRK